MDALSRKKSRRCDLTTPLATIAALARECLPRVAERPRVSRLAEAMTAHRAVACQCPIALLAPARPWTPTGKVARGGTRTTHIISGCVDESN